MVTGKQIDLYEGVSHPYWKPAGWPTVRELLEIAESAVIPAEMLDGAHWGDFVFRARDGWMVRLGFDGDPDNIDAFLSPYGEVFRVWEHVDLAYQWSPLKNWRRAGSLAEWDRNEPGWVDQVDAMFTSDTTAFEAYSKGES